MEEQLSVIREKYEQLSAQLLSPESYADPALTARLSYPFFTMVQIGRASCRERV